jgi:hypothetical protein
VNALTLARGNWTRALLRWIGAACTAAADSLESPPLRADWLETRELENAHEHLSDMRARYY